MPTYDYRCEACAHAFERYQPITAKPIRKCPSCGDRKVVRLIGAGGGVIFKGSGFYETDYRSEEYKKAADADKKSGDKSTSKDKSSDSKTSSSETAKSTSKPGSSQSKSNE